MPQKIVFIGNCQCASLSKSTLLNDYFCKYYLFSYPHGDNSESISKTKAYLYNFFAKQELQTLLKSAALRIRPSVEDIPDDTDVFVLNMFHENPCYWHNEHDFCFEYHPGRHSNEYYNSSFLTSLDKEFNEISPSVGSYFSRLYDFIVLLMQKFPKALFVVLKRIDHGTINASVLSNFVGWENIQGDLEAFCDRLGNLSNLAIIDLELILSDFLNAGNQLQDILPFKVSSQIIDNKLLLKYAHDLEHPLPFFWDAVAQQLLSIVNPATNSAHNLGSLKSHAPQGSHLSGYFLDSKMDSYLSLLSSLNEAQILQYAKDIKIHLLASKNPSFNSKVLEILKSRVAPHDSVAINYRRAFVREIFSMLEQGGEDVGSRKIALWGAGGRAKFLLNNGLTKNLGKVVLIIDSDRTKSGEHIDGVPIVCPESLDKKTALTFDSILVASTYYDEIMIDIVKNSNLCHTEVLNSDDIILRYIVKSGEIVTSS